MSENSPYIEFKTIEYSKDGMECACRLAFDSHAAARVKESLEKLPGIIDEDTLDELLDMGAVFHDDVDENGRRIPSERWTLMHRGKSREVMRAYRLHGRLDNPAPLVPAYLRRSANTLRISARSFWEEGLLNDPAPLVAALMKFGFPGGANDSLPDGVGTISNEQRYIFGSEYLPWALPERYRAHFRKGEMYDPAPGIASEQWRQPETGRIYCAHSASPSRYLSRAEIVALEAVLAVKPPSSGLPSRHI